MLSYPDMNSVLDRCDSAFNAIIVASKRARRLNDGADLVLEKYVGSKSVSKAFEEIVANKLIYVEKE